MVKESTGDLSRMQRIDELSGGRLPFYNGSNPLVLDALQAGAAGWCTAAPCLRPQPCIDLYDAVRASDLEAKLFTPTSGRCWSSSSPGGLATTVKAGLELLGVGVGDPRRHCCRLTTRGAPRCRSCWPARPRQTSATRFCPLQLLLRETCATRRKNYDYGMSLAFFSTAPASVIYDCRSRSRPAERTPPVS